MNLHHALRRALGVGLGVVCFGASEPGVTVTLTATAAGPLTPGSVTSVHFAVSSDLAGSLDSASIPTPTGLEFPGVTLQASPGVTFRLDRVEPGALDATLAVDASASLGAIDVAITSGGSTWRADAALTVVQAPSVDQLATPWAPRFAPTSATSWIPARPELVLFEAAATDAAVKFAVLDVDGRFPRPLAFSSAGPRLLELPTARAVSAWTTDTKVEGVSIDGTLTPLRAVPESEPNETPALATAAGGADVAVLAATLTSASDVDCWSLDLDEGAIGRTLHAETLPGDPSTDTAIVLIASDAASVVGLPSSDLAYHDTLDAVIPARGRHSVCVRAGSAFVPDHGTYSLAMVLR